MKLINSKKTLNKYLYSANHVRYSNNNGQVMLTAILILGASMIGASLIAGFLTVRSIRQGTFAETSAKAIFAADAGIDYLFYRCFKWIDPSTGEHGCQEVDRVFNLCDTGQPDFAPFANKSCYIASYQKDAPGPSGLFTELKSVGYSDFNTKVVSRTFIVTFQ